MIIQLAKSGYYHLDLHFNNILIDKRGQMIWIDTHIKRLPQKAAARRYVLDEMIDPIKLEGAQYIAKKFANE